MIQKMNAGIATRFEEVAIILEAQQANPYRVQASSRRNSAAFSLTLTRSSNAPCASRAPRMGGY
jgi:hypothetical protein